MAYSYNHHPNHREASFREERYCAENLNRAPHHNRAEYREEDYYASNVEAPVRYESAAYRGDNMYGRPGYGRQYEDKVADYDVTEIVREDIVQDDCVGRKHHGGRFDRVRAFI